MHEWLDQVFVSDTTYAHLILAMLLGGAIGLERQWRQRSAGLRTTVLVCIGSASFVDLAAAIAPGTTGVTQVVAYVVSGVGFLGAGAIMREGLSIRGINTAATIWCSAAVGASAGTGEVMGALATTVAVIFVNVMVRPVVLFVERRANNAERTDDVTMFHLVATCARDRAPAIRALLVDKLSAGTLRLTGLRDESTGDQVTLSADLTALVGTAALDVEHLAAELSAEAGVSGTTWRLGDTGVARSR